MRRFLLSVIVSLSLSYASFAQNIIGQIALFPVVFEDGLTSEAASVLTNKISAISANNGFGSIDYAERFIISVRADIIGNSVTPTNPPRVSKQISLTFIIGDILENKSFAATSVTVNGIGTSDNKALIAAINRISPNSKAINGMMTEATTKIIDYYGSNSYRFTSTAKALALKGNYDEAIAYLMSIPPINDECFTVCQNYAIQLYQDMIDEEGFALYNEAKAEWISDKTRDGAYRASQQLKKIKPLATCFSDAIKLWNEIEEKLDADEKAAKAFAMQQYNDNLEIQHKKMDNNQSFRMSIVDACKSIGTAYGEHRPQNVTKLVRGWF